MIDVSEIFRRELSDPQLLVEWYDGIQCAALPGAPDCLVGILAWMPEREIKIYAVIELSSEEFEQLEKFAAREFHNQRRELIKRILVEHAESHAKPQPTIVALAYRTSEVLGTRTGETKDVLKSLPFDIESALRPEQVLHWKHVVSDLVSW